MAILDSTLEALGLGVGGADSGTMTPESIELRRKMALAMLQNKEPIKSTTQGMNSVLEKMIGAYRLRQADEADKAGKKEADDLLAQVFGGAPALKPSRTASLQPSSSALSDAGPAAGAGPMPDIAPYANAIAAVESANSPNPYAAIGPRTRSGDRAIGKYQVMGANIPDWTEKHLGKRMSVAEFRADPDAQEKVFAGEFGSYLQKYGNPDDAASMWFSGKPAAQGSDRDDQYTSQPEYLRRFNAALKTGGGPKLAQAGAGPVTDATPGPANTVDAGQNASLQRALVLMRNPRTAPIGQALLQKAMSAETKDPLVVKTIDPSTGAEVSMIYDRASGTLKPLSSLMGAPAAPAMAPESLTAPPAAAEAPGAPSVQNIGEIGPGPLELAAQQPNAIGGQVANAAVKGDAGIQSAVPQAPMAPPALIQALSSEQEALPAGLRPGPAWVGKLPEGYIQRTVNGQTMVGPDGKPALVLKSEADAKAKATEAAQVKRAEAQVDSDRQVGGVQELISSARENMERPGFKEGLDRLRKSVDVSVPIPATGGGRLGGDLMAIPNYMERNRDPDDPRWAAMDNIKSTQRSLELLVARPLMKGQGQVTDSERSMISEAIGNLPQATSRADYAFKLRNIQNMIEAMNAAGGEGRVVRASSKSTAPTVSEIAAATDASGNLQQSKVNELAQRYSVKPDDMREYLNALKLREKTDTGQRQIIIGDGPNVSTQPKSVLDAMSERMGY